MPRPPLGRQQLLDAARAELVAGGGRADLASLVRRAGVSTGALYHHFGSRTGLLAAIFCEFYDGLDEAISDAHLPGEATWTDRELRRTRHLVAYCQANPLSPLLLDRGGREPALAELEAAYLERLIDMSARNIRHGQQLGEVDSSLVPETAAAFVIGGVWRSIVRQLRRTPPPGVDEATEELWHLVAATFGIRSAG